MVYLSKNEDSDELYAVKVIEPSFVSLFNKEVSILSSLDHPNIIKFIESYKDETNRGIIILEYADNGDLYFFFDEHKPAERDLAKYFYQITKAIEYIHSKGIIHRDVKPDNIFLFKDGTAKLGDFGLSVKETSYRAYGGTIDYMAPELFDNKVYGKDIDIWSLGVTIGNIVSGFDIFTPLTESKEGDSELAIIRNIKEVKYQLSREVSPEVMDLVSICLRKDPTKRPSASDLLGHPWFKKHNCIE